jgi:hypothetical protein
MPDLAEKSLARIPGDLDVASRQCDGHAIETLGHGVESTPVTIRDILLRGLVPF